MIALEGQLEGAARFSAKLREGLPALTVLASHDELPGIGTFTYAKLRICPADR